MLKNIFCLFIINLNNPSLHCLNPTFAPLPMQRPEGPAKGRESSMARTWLDRKIYGQTGLGGPTSSPGVGAP